MNKLLSLILGVLLLAASYLSVSARNVPNDHVPEIPEENGDYQDPEHPWLRIRVIVHHERPTSSVQPLLVCGLNDPESPAVVSPAGWHLPSNWTYNLNPSSVPSSVEGGNLPAIAANGFSDWASASGNKVTFTKGSDTTATRSAYDGKNIIAWGRTNGTALGVTYIRYYSVGGLVVDVDTIMNKKFPWSWSNSNTCADPNTYDAEDILTHELGHWLGLDDEYTNEYVNNTMYGYGSKGEVKKNTLTSGDKAGAASIY